MSNKNTIKRQEKIDCQQMESISEIVSHIRNLKVSIQRENSISKPDDVDNEQNEKEEEEIKRELKSEVEEKKQESPQKPKQHSYDEKNYKFSFLSSPITRQSCDSAISSFSSSSSSSSASSSSSSPLSLIGSSHSTEQAPSPSSQFTTIEDQQQHHQQQESKPISPISSLNSLNSSNIALYMRQNNGKVSNNIKEKLAKSLNNNTTQLANISPQSPITNSKAQHQKQNRLKNFMRLTNQKNAFFSKSCPINKDLQKQKSLNETQDNFPCQTQSIQQTHPSTQSQSKLSLGRNFLLTLSANSKFKKSFDSSSLSKSYQSRSPSRETDSSHTMDDVLKSKETNISTRKPYLHKKIQSFDVDIEQLARELMMPSKDAPLTSFKSDTDSHGANLSVGNGFKLASELESSRTVDEAFVVEPTLASSAKNASKKKSLFRSLTQSK